MVQTHEINHRSTQHSKSKVEAALLDVTITSAEVVQFISTPATRIEDDETTRYDNNNKIED